VQKFEADAPDFVSPAFRTRIEQALIKADAPGSVVIAALGGATPNTLDGQITTGWNSNGSTPGQGVDPVGQKLTYKLSAPQHIVGVRLINGYNPNDANHQFTDNYRVHSLILRGGGQERTVDLADSFSPQFVEVDFPNADTVELEIASVYPTNKWKDVGITEVQFFAR